MSNQDKFHTGHRTSMLHLRYLASFMDEIDREVVSLTDRAFKSLCIGDEAIYNDSEFSPCPVSCHKPIVEEVSKKTQESSFSAVNKVHSYLLNGENDALGRPKKTSSKDTSHFAVFSAKNNSECTKMIYGESWDKSAFLNIKRELSELSSDYHSITVEQFSSANNNVYSDEKGYAKKSSKDVSIPSRKSSKCKHKSNKLKKLNSKNVFLHSEFSPFLSWRDLNTFYMGQDHISEIMLSNRQSKWYDSPLYKELTAAHEHYKLHVTPSEDKDVESCPKQTETHKVKVQPESVQSTSPSTPSKPKKETQRGQHNIVSKAALLTTEKRCNSEKVESCVPWRKNKTRAKSAIPFRLSLITLPVYEGTKAGEEGAQPIEKEIKTIEDQTSSSSTPFSISHLSTPVILSSQCTGTSEILQAVLPPTALDVPRIPEVMYPSPEIKREVYKSMASCLLFNLKDNRKRVKAMYSPPKFKGLDLTVQNKELPLLEVPGSKDELKIPEVSKATTISPARQKNIISPMSSLLESADTQNCSPHGYAKGGVPDDYLALSLLQSGGSANRPLNSNRNPLAIRVAYPSLQLYQKASVEESHFKAHCQTVVNTSSQVFTNKAINSEHIKYRDTHSNLNILVQGVNEEQQDKIPIVSLIRERAYENKSVKSQYANSTKCDDNKDKLETSTTVSMQKIPVKEKESNRKEDRAKHLFSARQNNFIKSQRTISKDDDDNDNVDVNSSNAGKVLLAINDTNCINVLSRHSKKAKTKELEQGQYNTGFHQDKGMIGAPTLKESANVKEETTTEKQSSFISISNSENKKEQVKNESMSMKGNIYAKRALFVSMEQVANKTTVKFKKDNTVIDKYDLAKMALEEVIADREQRKLKSKVVSNKKNLVMDRNRVGCELSTNGEDQQTSMFERNRDTIRKDGKSQNNASVFKTNKQAFQMISDDVVTKYDDSEESNRYKFNGNNIFRLQEKELAKNIGHPKVGTNRGHHLESSNIHSSGKCEEELGNMKLCFFHTPEVPRRRGRSTSEGNSRVAEKAMRNKELKSEDGTSFKTEYMENMENREASKFCQSQSKNQGQMKGNVSALKEIYDKESGVQRKDVQMYQFAGSTSSEKSKDETPNDQSPKDITKHKTIIPKVKVSSTESESFNKEMDSENIRRSESPSKASEKREAECDSQREHNDTQDFKNITISDLTNNKQELQNCKVNGTVKREEGSDKLKEPGNSHNKYKGPCQNYVKGIISGLLGLSNEKECHNCGLEKVIIVGEHDENFTKVDSFFEAMNANQSRKDSFTVHDILEHSPALSSPHSSPKKKELSLSHKSERGSQSHLELLTSNPEVPKLDEEEDSCTFDNHESESDVSDRVVSPLNDVKKKGWVHCLIESARNLTQVSYNMSHTELPETTQPLSLRESLNEPRNGEENLKRFKNCVHSEVALSSIPDKSPQANQPAALHLLSPLSTQLPSVKEGKLSIVSISVSEEEEQCSAVSTLSEGVESCTALTDAEGSKAHSERSGSACSGNDGHGQNKRPVVPPKTEKAMRRAMKLTTRRMYKSEAKSKFERRGRSSEKGISHENEKSYYSTDKTEGDRSERRSISGDRHSSPHSEDYLEDTLEPKTQRSEKQLRHLSNKGQDRQTNKVVDSKSHSTEKKHEQSNDIDHLEKINTNNNIDRMSRNNEKYVPKKQERRTQSLDRFLRDKHENKSNSCEQTEERVNSELLTGELHYSTSKALPLRQNTIEHTYATANNTLAQSFPITQRKLLQDPDSGQYFLVDMPVQVKSKTFFDPETKCYVQLPIQSPEGAIRQAPPLEVMNTPPLVLYHGFVPVPFSTLPSQKSLIRTTGSMNIPDDLDDFETGKKQMQEDFFQTQQVHPYIEPAYISQEHTPEEEVDSVR